MTKSKANAKSQPAKPSAKAAKRAPGNATAIQQKAADNVKRINNGRGKAETIAIVKNTVDGNAIYVEGSKGSSFTRDRRGDSKEFRAVAVKGALYETAAKFNKANPPPKPQARLANGLDARTAPQSAAAVRDQAKAAAKAGNGKGKAATPKATKNKAPSRGTDRSYTRGKTAINAKPDSWRYHMLTTITSAKDTASAKASHAKSKKFADRKLDFNWAASQGYITFAK